jgi:hypothetical protein
MNHSSVDFSGILPLTERHSHVGETSQKNSDTAFHEDLTFVGMIAGS